MIPPTTMNLLPKIEVSREIPERKDNGLDQTIKSMDLFAPHAGFMPSVTMEDAQKMADLRYGTVFSFHSENTCRERSSLAGLGPTRFTYTGRGLG